MSSKAFVKLVSDCKLIGTKGKRKLSRTDVDLIFTKAASLQQQHEQYITKSILSPRSPHSSSTVLPPTATCRSMVRRATQQTSTWSRAGLGRR